MNELITISSNTIDGQAVNTVNARDLHSFLEVGKDFSNWIKAQTDRARLVENRDYLVAQKGEQLPSGLKWLKEYYLTIDAAKHIAMMSGTDKGFDVRDYFIECERRAKSSALTFKLPSTYSEALRALADETERREHAERTKAEIGSRREATAMATASVAVRKANQLSIQLDHLKDYATIKRMSMLYHGTPFNWREMKSASAIMNLPAIDVFDVNYQTVKAYHRDVWRAVYALDTDGNPALPEIDDNNIGAEVN
jgi:phage anti-repressor protein